MKKAEDKIMKEIEEILRMKAESEPGELPDSEHGYVDALMWLLEGSIQLTNESVEKEMDELKYADKGQSKEYYDGFGSALKMVLKRLARVKE